VVCAGAAAFAVPVMAPPTSAAADSKPVAFKKVLRLSAANSGFKTRVMEISYALFF
jgi:hypothetical protein